MVLLYPFSGNFLGTISLVTMVQRSLTFLVRTWPCQRDRSGHPIVYAGWGPAPRGHRYARLATFGFQKPSGHQEGIPFLGPTFSRFNPCGCFSWGPNWKVGCTKNVLAFCINWRIPTDNQWHRYNPTIVPEQLTTLKNNWPCGWTREAVTLNIVCKKRLPWQLRFCEAINFESNLECILSFFFLLLKHFVLFTDVTFHFRQSEDFGIFRFSVIFLVWPPHWQYWS